MAAMQTLPPDKISTAKWKKLTITGKPFHLIVPKKNAIS